MPVGGTTTLLNLRPTFLENLSVLQITGNRDNLGINSNISP